MFGDIGCRINHSIENVPSPRVNDPWYWVFELPSFPGSGLVQHWCVYDWRYDEQWSFRKPVVLCNGFLWFTSGLLTILLSKPTGRVSNLMKRRYRCGVSAMLIAFLAGAMACFIGFLIIKSFTATGTQLDTRPFREFLLGSVLGSLFLSCFLFPFNFAVAVYALFPFYRAQRNA